MSHAILRVALPTPLHRLFDYLPPAGVDPRSLQPGVRLRVPFGRRRAVGVLWSTAEGSELPTERLRRAEAVLDAEALLPPDAMALAAWASRYYHHPPGEVVAAMLPAPLREGRPARASVRRVARLTESGAAVDVEQALPRAPRQRRLIEAVAAVPDGLPLERLADEPGDWRGALRALLARGWIAVEEAASADGGTEEPAPGDPPEAGPTLNEAQASAVESVAGALGGFEAFLLDGVTGSGKTEVYLHIIERALAAGRQALVLVPEIALTPQLVARFRRRLGVPLAILHSGLAAGERLAAWLAARDGRIPVVIGTRSAALTPLARPGIILVDEEHDPSFKQQEGLRYSARDVAVMRAREAGCPIVLGSATPSLESLHNIELGRYRRLDLPERAGAAAHPAIELLDLRGQPLVEGMANRLLGAVERTLEQGEQALLFLNRRGFAPTLVCHDCGWVAECPRCDAHLILHQARRQLRCHHCGAERAVERQCPSCGSVDLVAVGQGTERIGEALETRFPDTPILRIDRDTTRRKGSLEALLADARTEGPRILVGTQMLAKGHHFPNVTLVGVIDGDQGLFGADFRATERMAQLIMQVAGRAGRAEKPGRVLIQTHHPEHPLLARLIRDGYAAFAREALAERREAGLPPASHLALLRAEAPGREAPARFLEAAAGRARERAPADVEILGPVPAPMERRAGRYRAQLLVQSARRASLHGVLDPWVPELAQLVEARRVRWSIDIDPQDLL